MHPVPPTSSRRARRVTAACIAGLALLSPALMADEHGGEHASIPPDAAALIEALALEGHIEGGFYRRTYEATGTPRVDAGHGERFSMTSIYYLLTAAGPVGHFHRNRSDIVHYFHLGDPIEYFLIHPDGRLDSFVMGPDPTRGQRLQLTVPGGTWKASRLRDGSRGYGLISEAVSPGFDYADMTLGRTSTLIEAFPQHADLIRALSRESAPGTE